MVLFFGASTAGVGVIVYVLAKKLGSSSKIALLSQTIFFLSFSIFFAFATNMHTYDEPLQYIFIFASLIFLLRNNNYLFGLCFFIALLARETTILLVPALLFISYKSSHINFKQTFKTLFAVSILFLVYYSAWSLWGSSDRTNIDYLEKERFLEWRYSFQNWQFAKESFVMALAVLAPWVCMAYYSIKYKLFSNTRRLLIYGFIITCIINTPISFVAARAQEARIFALPVIFLWPLAGEFLLVYIQVCKKYLAEISNLWRGVYFIVSLIFAWYIAFIFFDPTHSGIAGYAFQIYIFLILWVLIYAVYICRPKHSVVR
jgi:hypothetical protein